MKICTITNKKLIQMNQLDIASNLGCLNNKHPHEYIML